MTQRHFEAIAAILAGDLALAESEGESAAYRIRGVILSLAEYFASENPRFKRSTFYLACGLTGDGGLGIHE
jgi:hypothetical protein